MCFIRILPTAVSFGTFSQFGIRHGYSTAVSAAEVETLSFHEVVVEVDIDREGAVSSCQMPTRGGECITDAADLREIAAKLSQVLEQCIVRCVMPGCDVSTRTDAVLLRRWQ
jgi:hypothetical protein